MSIWAISINGTKVRTSSIDWVRKYEDPGKLPLQPMNPKYIGVASRAAREAYTVKMTAWKVKVDAIATTTKYEVGLRSGNTFIFDVDPIGEEICL